MMDPTDDILAKIVKNMISSPQASALGFELVSISVSNASIRVPWREELVGDPDTGVIAGGVVTSLLDHACGLAMHAAPSNAWGGPTLDLRIDYMRPAEPKSSILAEATCYKLTRTIAFVRASAYDARGGEPIATAQGAFARTERRK